MSEAADVAAVLFGVVVLLNVAPLPIWMGFRWLREAATA